MKRAANNIASPEPAKPIRAPTRLPGPSRGGFAAEDTTAVPSPEEQLEAWLKRPWPETRGKDIQQDDDNSPSALELP